MGEKEKWELRWKEEEKNVLMDVSRNGKGGQRGLKRDNSYRRNA